MTISTGSLIQAIDYVSLAGLYANTQAFPDSGTATNKLNAIYGVGYGDRGYGQSVPFVKQVTNGSVIESADWQGLRSELTACATYLGVNVPNLPDASFYDAGSQVAANDFNWVSYISQIDFQRLIPNPSNLSVTSLLSDTRTSNWTERPQLVAEIDFGVEDVARWFFNSGGRIRINSSFVPSVVDPQESSWQQMLQDAGTIQVGAYNTTRQNGDLTKGVLSNTVGYYNLGASASTVFVIRPSTTTFAVNSYSILIQRANYQAKNGGNGSKLIINVLFDDAYGGPAQPVQGTLTCEISMLKASAVLSIAAPSVLLSQSLSGGGGETYFEFTDTINTTVYNYNVLDRAAVYASVADPPVNLSVVPIRATVVVTGSGVIGSTTHTVSSLRVPAGFLPGSSVKIINSGYIVGKGGSGGTGAPSGVCGCVPGEPGEPGGTALLIETPILLLNYGIIGGGGGGGGGGGAECGYIWNASAGGGGGGAPDGIGGGTNGCGVTVGRFGGTGANGNLLTGGSGGRSGNGITATGGRGGDLGQFGTAGQTISANGGVGGAPGAAIVGIGQILAGSILGDCKGSIT